MIRDPGIELESLNGLAQNKTSGWFIMLLVFKPLREILLLVVAFLFWESSAQIEQRQRPRTAQEIMIWKTGGRPFSFLNFLPRHETWPVSLLSFVRSFNFFPWEEIHPKWREELIGFWWTERYPRQKKKGAARRGRQESGETPEIAGFWCWVLQGSFKWDPFFGDQIWCLNLWSFQGIFLKDGALFGLLFENDPCNVPPPLPAYPPHQKEQ